MKYSPGAILVSLALLGGCASTSETPQPSGFLGDYSQLQPAPDREGVMLYVDKSTDFRPYTKLHILPIQVLVTQVPDTPPLDPDVVQRIGAQMRDSLQHALVPQYQLVDQNGPDVLTVRAAITGLQPVKLPTTATDFLPIKAIYNAGKAATGHSERVVEMKSEVEVLDPNGKRVIAGTATRRGDQRLQQGEQITWDALPPITDYWASNVRNRLDQLRGVAPPPVASSQ